MIHLTHARTAWTDNLEVFDGINVPQHAHFFPETYKRVKRGLTYPPHKLLEKCLDEEIMAAVRDHPRPGKTGFIFSVGSQVWMHESSRFPDRDDKLDYRLKLPYLAMTQIYCGRLASMFGATGHVSTDASACASSLKCMMDVINLIRHHRFDRIVVAAVDDVVNNAQLNIFGEAGASITIEEEEQGLAPSAFDAVNGGFRLGQGAAIAVFERDHDAMDAPLGTLRGAFTGSENLDNSIGQRTDGAGFTEAIDGALWDAGLAAGDVSIVKTHGTGTDLNNASERGGIAAAGLGDFVATSYKPRLGHTMGASGLLESILLLREIGETGRVPEIPGRTEDDPVYLSAPAEAPDGPILSLAAGMGNVYSAALFERP